MIDQKKLRRGIIVLMVLAIIAGAAWEFIHSRNDFRYAGTLEATKVDLSARVASTIGSIRVQEGDEVKENQELALLTCEDIKVDAKLADENYQRNLRLFRAGTASQETMDVVRNKKEDMDVKLGWCAVRSPINGTVLSRYHEPGEWVTPGVKMLTLANIRDIWAYIYVPQPEVSRIRTGMAIQGYLPELNNRAFAGKIIKINEEAEFTPKNVQTRAERTRLVFGVKISFSESNLDQVLKPGMTIEAVLPGK